MSASSSEPHAPHAAEVDEPITVVAAVVTRSTADGRVEVFAARRSLGRQAGGLWEFPGGKVEPGETEPEALIREIREELGAQIAVGEHAGSSQTLQHGLLIHLRCYWARFDGSEPVHSTDHDQLAWFSLEEIPRLSWAPGDVPVIPTIIRALESSAAQS